MSPNFLTIALAAFGLSAVARATVVVADFNDLTTGNLQNQEGGTGFTGAWGDTATLGVYAGNLTAPASTNYAIVQSGTAQSVRGAHTAYRQSSRALTTSLEGVVWFSFLVNNPEATSNAGVTFGVSGYNSGFPRVGLSGNTLYAGVTSYDSTGLNVNFGETALIVGRLTLAVGQAAANEQMEIWLNPDVSGGIAGLGAPDGSYSENLANLYNGLSRVAVFSYREATGTAGTVDSFLLSDAADANQAFADVTGVLIPEPSVWLLGLCGAGLAWVRRRG